MLIHLVCTTKTPHALQFSHLHLFSLLLVNSRPPVEMTSAWFWVSYPSLSCFAKCDPTWFCFAWQNQENILYRPHFATCLTSRPCAVSHRSTVTLLKMWTLNYISTRETWQLSVLQPSEWAGLHVNNGCSEAEWVDVNWKQRRGLRLTQ